jgi:hypothetical protein
MRWMTWRAMGLADSTHHASRQRIPFHSTNQGPHGCQRRGGHCLPGPSFWTSRPSAPREAPIRRRPARMSMSNILKKILKKVLIPMRILKMDLMILLMTTTAATR